MRINITNVKDAIPEIIKKHEAEKIRTYGLYERYLGKNLPIMSRPLPDASKADNKLSNDYRGNIINQSVGYLWGNPISYVVDEQTIENETEREEYDNKLQRFLLINAIEDLDSETGKMMSICGYTYRLFYVDKDAEVRAMGLTPWETVIVEDFQGNKYAMRYYKRTVLIGGKEKELTSVEWYDDKKITFYLEGENGKYELDNNEVTNPLIHNFDYVPVVKFSNNEEEQGDFEKVENLIDSYDLTLSDAQNELETFALAYIVTNTEFDKETVKAAKQTGVFQVDDPEKMKFLVKEINDQFLENQKTTLNDNIYKFASAVDIENEKFSGGAQTGESRKWKLLTLENKSITKERKFSKALREQWKVVTSAWNKKEITTKYDYLAIYWTFTRNIPVDLVHIGDAIGKLKGVVSNQTLLGAIPLVDNVKWEQEQIELEREGKIRLDDLEDDENEEEV